MNEKIKELAEQATKHYPAIESSGEFWTFDKEKFAELIVGECGEIAYRAYWDNPDSVRGIHIKEQIKNHFGVK